MRMKFTISYKAEWGESLHADITFFARDGKRKVVDLAMNTVCLLYTSPSPRD